MYKIGEPVVCVDASITLFIKKDEVYPIKSTSNCNCGTLLLNVGVISDVSTDFLCPICYKSTQIEPGDTVLFRSVRFVPLDNLYNKEIKQLTEVLTETIEV